MIKSVIVRLNGTTENPYSRMGLTRNPFPPVNKVLEDLYANPIKNIEDLKNRLKGCTQEFIDICVNNYTPNQITNFTITWDEDDNSGA